MARDRRLTRHKLDRLEGALAEVLDCADVEFSTAFERAQRAVKALRTFLEADLPDDEDEGPRALTAAPSPETP